MSEEKKPKPKKRRARGTGGAYQVARGKWRAFKELPNEDGSKSRRWVSGTSRADVEAKLELLVPVDWAAVRAAEDEAAAIAEQEDRERRRREFETVDAAATQYIASAGKLSVKTRSQYEWLRNRHLGDLASMHASEVTVSDIQRRYQEMRDAGLSDSAVSALHALLKKSFDIAKPYAMHNPARDVSLPKKEVRRNDQGVDDEGLVRLQEALTDDPLRASWELALRLGIRPSERLGLTWDRIDLDGGRLHIRGQQQRVALKLDDGKPLGDVYLPWPKTARGDRVIGLPDDIAELLRTYYKDTRQEVYDRDVAGEFEAQQQRQRERIDRAVRSGIVPGGAKNTPHPLPDNLVFLRPPGPRREIVGAPLDHSSDQRLWKALVKRAGLPEMARYGARHGVATRAFQRIGTGEGSALKVSEILGHHSPAFTLRTYVGALDSITDEFGKTL
ncbi:site-specific integrase [Microbacterium sp. GXF6406]